MTTATIDLLDLDRFQRLEHHAMFERLRAEDPVSWHEYPGEPGFWNVVTHEDILTVSRDSELFSSESGGVMIMNPEAQGGFDTRGLMMLYTDPPRHTRYRRLVSKGFTPRMIGMIEQYLRNRSHLIVDNIIERGQCDFVVDLASELPLQAIADLMGVPQEDRGKLFEWSNQMMSYDDPDYDDQPDVAAAEILAYFMAMAEDRKANPRDDLVTKLITADIDGHALNEDEFGYFTIMLTVAGNETTRNAITHGMNAFFDHPEQWELFKASRPDTAADEIVRWATPITVFQRTATRDVELGGQQITAGQRVGLFYRSANFDEEVFAEPGRFEISRSPNPHLGYGGLGTHYCLGASLAKLEIDLIFNAIADAMPDIAKAGDPVRLRSGWINCIKSLPVTYRP